jgi:hypothetical protein
MINYSLFFSKKIYKKSQRKPIRKLVAGPLKKAKKAITSIEKLFHCFSFVFLRPIQKGISIVLHVKALNIYYIFPISYVF